MYIHLELLGQWGAGSGASVPLRRYHQGNPRSLQALKSRPLASIATVRPSRDLSIPDGLFHFHVTNYSPHARESAQGFSPLDCLRIRNGQTFNRDRKRPKRPELRREPRWLHQALCHSCCPYPGADLLLQDYSARVVIDAAQFRTDPINPTKNVAGVRSSWQFG